MRALARLAIAACLVGAACAGNDGDSAIEMSRNCDPAPFCDIRDPLCQVQVFQATACVNGLAAAAMPAVQIVTPEQYERAELEEASEQIMALSPSELRQNRALQMLGLLGSQQNWLMVLAEEKAAKLRGSYSGRVVTILDRDLGMDPTRDLEVLSHEFVHAQRDQLHPFGDLAQQETADGRFAVTTLIEGEARVVSQRVIYRARGESTSDHDWAAEGMTALAEHLTAAEQANNPYVDIRIKLVYFVGALELGPLWEAGGRSAVDALFDDPEPSLLAFAAPGVSMAPLGCYPTAPPPGYVIDAHTRTGLLYVLALPLTLRTRDGATAFEQSKSWRNDRLVLFRPQADEDSMEVAIAWRVAFDSYEHADAFQQSVAGALPAGMQVAIADREVLIYGASDPAVLGGWASATTCGSESDLPR